MKLLPFYAALLFISTSVQAQNEQDAQGRKQGQWVKTYEGTEDLRYSGQFKDDEPYGLFKYYYEGGQLSAEIRFSEGGTISRARNFHNNGNLMAEGKYVEQKKDSVWTYYDRSAVKRSTEQYANGKLNGVSITYYSNGKMAESSNWTNGVQTGEWKQFFDDGTVKVEATYVNDGPEGEMTFYYPNGKFEIKGQIHNGFRDGNWIYYNQDGSIQMQVVYQWGKVVKEKKENGVFKEYYNEDVPKSEYTYAKGMKNGPFKEYYEQGEWVIEDRPVGPKGEPEDKVKVLKGQQVRREGKYKNDMLDGEVRYYYDNGHLEKTEKYKAGVLQNQ